MDQRKNVSFVQSSRSSCLLKTHTSVVSQCLVNVSQGERFTLLQDKNSLMMAAPTMWKWNLQDTPIRRHL